MQCRSPSENRRIGGCHHLEWLHFDIDELQGILGDGAMFGDHDGHGFADVPYAT